MSAMDFLYLVGGLSALLVIIWAIVATHRELFG